MMDSDRHEDRPGLRGVHHAARRMCPVPARKNKSYDDKCLEQGDASFERRFVPSWLIRAELQYENVGSSSYELGINGENGGRSWIHQPRSVRLSFGPLSQISANQFAQRTWS